MAFSPSAVIDLGSIWFEESSVGSTLYPPGSTLGPRIQAYVQLVFLHFGTLTVNVDGTKQALKADTVGLLLPGHEEYFEFARTTETLHSYVHIRPDTLAPEVQRRLTTLPRVLPLSRALENLIHQATTAPLSVLPTRNKIFEALALQMLWHYIGEAEALGAHEADDTYRRVPKAQLFIHDHLAEALDLERIARAVRLSKPQLTRIFKRELGVTPMVYVWQRRTAAATELLKHSGLSIDAISERCGFASRYHLSRRVKEAAGMSPGVLRRSYWRAQHTPFALER